MLCTVVTVTNTWSAMHMTKTDLGSLACLPLVDSETHTRGSLGIRADRCKYTTLLSRSQRQG